MTYMLGDMHNNRLPSNTKLPVSKQTSFLPSISQCGRRLGKCGMFQMLLIILTAIDIRKYLIPA